MSDNETEEPKRAKKPSKPPAQRKDNDQLKCPQCDSIVPIYCSPEMTYFTVITVSVTIVLFRIWSFFLLPFIIPLSKAIVVRCTRCDAKLEVHQPFNLFSLKDEVVTLQCGECALVISRSYLLAAISVILCFFVYFWSGEHIEHARVYSNATWPEYLGECGGEMVLKNSIRVSETFSSKYEGKTIVWEGYLMRATENYGWFKGDHSVIVLVKMQPSESDIHADLILSMDDEDFQRNKAALATLDRGTSFIFNATFVTPGNEQQLHHLHAHYIEKTDKFLEIPAHVHSVNHRYNLNTQGAQASISN